jgi:hypothetical protein
LSIEVGKGFIAYTGCPIRYRTRHFFNNFTTNDDIATKFKADLPHCVRNVKEKNVLLFKFRYNIFIGVRIIKEMPGLVASGKLHRRIKMGEKRHNSKEKLCDVVANTGWAYLLQPINGHKINLHITQFHFPTEPRHHPVATCVNTTKYCKYSQVLLMMGKNITRNM